MGTGPFAVPAFDAIASSGDDAIVTVVTRPAVIGKSRGGPPPQPVRDWATGRSFEILDPPSVNDEQTIAQLAERSPDLFVVCDYGQILSSEALAVPRLGGINLHGSLLPRHRGAAPVQWAVLNGDDHTGVSVLHMTPRLDAGPILRSAATPIHPSETAGSLEHRLAEMGVAPTLAAIEDLRLWNGRDPIGTPQDPDSATRAPRLKKPDGSIDWGRSVAEVDCHIRGMNPWPLAFTHFKPHPDKPPIRIAIHHAEPSRRSIDEATFSGEIVTGDDGVEVACDDGWIRLITVQPAGKKPMSAIDFMRGHRPPPGSRMFEAPA